MKDRSTLWCDRWTDSCPRTKQESTSVSLFSVRFLNIWGQAMIIYAKHLVNAWSFCQLEADRKQTSSHAVSRDGKTEPHPTVRTMLLPYSLIKETCVLFHLSSDQALAPVTHRHILVLHSPGHFLQHL